MESSGLEYLGWGMDENAGVESAMCQDLWSVLKSRTSGVLIHPPDI